MRKNALKTGTLSARVTVDTMFAIDEICEKQGITRSQWVTTAIVEQKANEFMLLGGQIQARTIPLELQELLTAAGVATTGILAYTVIGKYLEKTLDKDGNPKFSEAEIQIISIISSLAIAMAGFGVIKALTGENKD